MSNNQFNGLTMPVFMAFGWAGEETAINFALSQLELFIEATYFSLPRDAQAQFQFHGLDRGSQSVFLSSGSPPESDLYIAFFARPMNLETSLSLTDKSALTKAYRVADSQPKDFFDKLHSLGSEWNLRIQQMEYDDSSQTATHYQDLYKGAANRLDAESAATIIARATFLNSESQWIVPIHVSRRKDSEKVAAMGQAIVRVTVEEINALLPLCQFLAGRTPKPKGKKRKSTAKKRPQVPDTPVPRLDEAANLDSFIYVSELKPLHIRRGFVNLTPNHWPFFATNVRTETRAVTLKYGEHEDKRGAVWRLVPSDQARIVLSPSAHQWLEDHFGPDDPIQVTATKSNSDEIIISLTPIS